MTIEQEMWEDLMLQVVAESRYPKRLLDRKHLLKALRAFKRGDFSVRLPVDLIGADGEIATTFNDVVELNEQMTRELERISSVVGKDGRISQRGKLRGATGSWEECIDSVNTLIGDLVQPITEVARVIGAVAKGDLSQTMLLEIDDRPLRGEFLRIGKVVNTMVDQLNSFASEVTRVAREVGTEGKLGGQAKVEGVAGTWKDLTDNVNLMAANLTGQVRGIADVVTAVAKGNLQQKLAVKASGEIAALADTINGMIETLATFADQVTNVAREVGIEGKLGGQARVPGAAGLWRDLTDNVNQLAANLTTQVRAIAEVATAVTTGDLTRSITVEASGEVAALKDNINEMIHNLADTTRKNTEQDWLKTNLAKFTRVLQGERDLVTVTNRILSELAPLVNASHGTFYLKKAEDGEEILELVASYAYTRRKHLANRFSLREGLIGQCAFEKRDILLTNVPRTYIRISSGLGAAPPLNIIVLPVLFEGEVQAVLELASFERFSEIHHSFLDQLMESIGIVLNTIATNMRTERLLAQSQRLTAELQSQQGELKKTNDRLAQQAASLQKSEELLKSQQEELRHSNEQLEDKAQLLGSQKKQVELKNQEIEHAKAALEEKAAQLALTSKYKSEFLANMSHELRTPLNSLLILSKLLAENADKNLCEKQVQFAETIHTAGTELLTLINDILDLSKIESGTVTLDIGEVNLGDLKDYVSRSFGQIADDRKLEFAVTLDTTLPKVMHTDSKRLQQVIKNLLSNAFKFTERGNVELKIARATNGWSSRNNILNSVPMVVAFAVRDTGIGIASDKQKVIFEAFQQLDGTPSRKYGGTGLGLSISREIARLLGGEIAVVSTPGRGSIFTLFVPISYKPAVTASRPNIGVDVDLPVVNKPAQLSPQSEFRDDRHVLEQGDPALLIVEDDPKFASILLDMARERGLKGLVSSSGSDALVLARRFKPDAITLDIKLSDMNGWVLLDILKRNCETRHTPVNVISVEAPRDTGLQLGAFSVLAKPVDRETLFATFEQTANFLSRKVKQLLVVENDEVRRANIVGMIGNGDVETMCVSSGEAALTAIRETPFDCMILNPALPDMDGLEVLAQLRRNSQIRLPVIIYAASDLSTLEKANLRKMAESVVVESPASLARLLDDSAVFLHRRVVGLPEEKQKLLASLRQREPLLSDRKILIVDDDIRNIFSLTSVLEQHNVKVFHAETGRDGIAILEETSGIDLVLMDVMMPDMDGYETVRSIRARDRFKTLPIIAITAKAMKGDREKCIKAGASDYAAKPVDIDHVLSATRVWLREH